MNARVTLLQSVLVVSALMIVAIASSTHTLADASEWPARTTPRPLTTDGVPHVQIDVEPVPELTEQLLRQVASIPGVEIRDTVISLPGAKGFWLQDELTLARPDAIVGGREFAHVHPDGSLHAALHPDTARRVIEAGWAVHHPWSNRRPGWEGFVMIYTPMTAEELDIVSKLVVESYEFVTGKSLN